MIELRITKTCAHAMTGKNAGFSRYDTARKSFGTVEEARAWIVDEYGSSRRAPMYRDNPGGGAVKVGYVIGFRCKYRNPGDAVMEQHWVEFTEVRPVEKV